MVTASLDPLAELLDLESKGVASDIKLRDYVKVQKWKDEACFPRWFWNMKDKISNNKNAESRRNDRVAWRCETFLYS